MSNSLKALMIGFAVGAFSSFVGTMADHYLREDLNGNSFITFFAFVGVVYVYLELRDLKLRIK